MNQNIDLARRVLDLSSAFQHPTDDALVTECASIAAGILGLPDTTVTVDVLFPAIPMPPASEPERPWRDDQRLRIFGLLSRLGVDEQDRHSLATDILGFPVDSFTDFTESDADRLTDALAYVDIYMNGAPSA